jgi:protein TonB
MMKRILVILLIFAVWGSAKAQTQAPIPKIGDTTKIFTAVEVEPSFPGGVEGFYNYLGKSIQYPQQARSNGETGRVIVQMIVEKDGSLSHIVVLRSVSYALDAEAVRVVTASPKWHPGIQNGRPVRVQYIVPINFSLK